jgi:RNA polymerase sigma factor (sigma-70 family)
MADQLMSMFKEKSITALGLSKRTEMRLWGLGIETIAELTDKSREKLQSEMKKMSRSAEGIPEIEKRLDHFGLKLAKKKRRSDVMEFGRRVWNLPPAEPLDDEKAAQVLGGQFTLFQNFRQLGFEYRRSGDQEAKLAMQGARNTIAVLHTGLATQCARNKFPELKRIEDPAIDFDDLYQEGCLGLLDGVEHFDYARGFRFSTYAVWWVRKYIGRFLAEQKEVPIHVHEMLIKFLRAKEQLEKKLNREVTREDLAEAMGEPVEKIENKINLLSFWHHLSLDEPLPDAGGDRGGSTLTLLDAIPAENPSADEELERLASPDIMTRIFEAVPMLEIEKQCLEFYFGLNGHRAMTLQEIGDYFGLTRERIRQRLEAVMNRMRNPSVWEIANEYSGRKFPAPSVRNPVKFSVGDRSNSIEKIKLAADKPEPGEPKEKPSYAKLAWPAMKIVNQVALNYKADAKDLLGFDQQASVVKARQVVMYRLREELGLTVDQIAEIFTRMRFTVLQNYSKIKSEVQMGIIPLGFFPPDIKHSARYAEPQPVDMPLTPPDKNLLDQGIKALGLRPETEKIIYTKRNVRTVRDLTNMARDRLLMTGGLDQEMFREIESALRRAGLDFAR